MTLSANKIALTDALRAALRDMDTDAVASRRVQLIYGDRNVNYHAVIGIDRHLVNCCERDGSSGCVCFRDVFYRYLYSRASHPTHVGWRSDFDLDGHI